MCIFSCWSCVVIYLRPIFEAFCCIFLHHNVFITRYILCMSSVCRSWPCVHIIGGFCCLFVFIMLYKLPGKFVIMLICFSCRASSIYLRYSVEYFLTILYSLLGIVVIMLFCFPCWALYLNIEGLMLLIGEPVDVAEWVVLVCHCRTLGRRT